MLWVTILDGRNPAPVDRWFIPLFIGFQPSKVVQDFFHPPWWHLSLVSHVSTRLRRVMSQRCFSQAIKLLSTILGSERSTNHGKSNYPVYPCTWVSLSIQKEGYVFRFFFCYLCFVFPAWLLWLLWLLWVCGFCALPCFTYLIIYLIYCNLILSNLISFYLVLSCFILSYLVLSCFILSIESIQYIQFIYLIYCLICLIYLLCRV